MKPIFALGVLLAVAAPLTARAQAGLPSGANVVAGPATIATTANSMTVTTGSQRTIIDYNSFNVGAGNSVRFDQPSSSSATLNRVISTEGSVILGSVSSNGQIFLVNPNGVFVGAGGSFSGSSVYLSTGNISNADFLGGNIRFDPPPPDKPIRFAGSIDATDMIQFNAGILDMRGTLNIHGGQIILDPPSINISLLEGGGNISFSGSGSGGNLSVSGGSVLLMQTPPIVTLVPETPPLFPGGTIVVSGSGSSGSLALSGGSGAISLPSPPVVVSGSATFPSGSASLTVTNSGGAIINWDNFAIGAGQSVNFVQPSASSAVLNRVTGDPKVILGNVTSNGSVWLTSPSGILVATGKTVPVSAMKIASASNRAPNPVAVPAPRGTFGLVDGTVTVRLSLVDATPITLR